MPAGSDSCASDSNNSCCDGSSTSDSDWDSGEDGLGRGGDGEADDVDEELSHTMLVNEVLEANRYFSAECRLRHVLRLPGHVRHWVVAHIDLLRRCYNLVKGQGAPEGVFDTCTFLDFCACAARLSTVDSPRTASGLAGGRTLVHNWGAGTPRAARNIQQAQRSATRTRRRRAKGGANAAGKKKRHKRTRRRAPQASQLNLRPTRLSSARSAGGKRRPVLAPPPFTPAPAASAP